MAFQPHAKRALSQDSDFPHTFSWSSGTTTGRQYSQSFSSDIQFDNLEIVPPINPTIVAALDPTTLEVEFDHSCLEGLDDQLLRFPTDAYAAICWAEAVNEPGSSSHRLFLSGSPTKSQEDSDESSDSLSNESDTDTDECRTLETYSLAVIPHVSHHSPISTESPFSASFEPSGKSILEPRITHFDPADSIGMFPVPQRRERATGVAAFRAYLPLRRKKSAIKHPAPH